MNTKVTTLAALVSSVLLWNVQEVAARRIRHPLRQPATTSPAQTSVPNASPPATTTETTGMTNQDATVKKMNEDEKQKVDAKGSSLNVEQPLPEDFHPSNVSTFPGKAA